MNPCQKRALSIMLDFHGWVFAGSVDARLKLNQGFGERNGTRVRCGALSHAAEIR